MKKVIFTMLFALLALNVKAENSQPSSNPEITISQKLALYKLWFLSELDQEVLTPMAEMAKQGIGEAIKAAQSAYYYSVGTYMRCAEGIDNCPGFPYAGAIIERLTEGYYRGLNEFQCEGGKLKKIQALQDSFGKQENLPLYTFFHTPNGDDVRVEVQNFGHGEKKPNCEMVYNDKTKSVQLTENPINKDCHLWERQNLNTLGYDTPTGPAYRCCQNRFCEKRVLKFKKMFAEKLSSQP